MKKLLMMILIVTATQAMANERCKKATLEKFKDVENVTAEQVIDDYQLCVDKRNRYIEECYDNGYDRCQYDENWN